MTYEEMVAVLKPEVVLSEAMVEQLKKYAALLKEWNEKFNLTAITEESQVVEKHFYDCLIPAKTLKISGKTLADLGTGAGFPGLVWAIAFPDCKVTLVEATGKKCTFLNEVIKDCGLNNAIVINKRCEEMKEREAFDIVTARALAPMGILLEISAPLVKVGGTFLAMKGSKGEEEFNKTGSEVKKLGLVLKEVKKEDLPGGEGSRQNFFFVKENKTQNCYPRPWATILKKPLL
jgi:16S rRNA (guanine527-N7)-methyltransferase